MQARTAGAALPTKKPRISVALSPSEASELQQLADENRVSCAWVARAAIIEYLDRHGGAQGALPLSRSKGAANDRS